VISPPRRARTVSIATVKVLLEDKGIFLGLRTPAFFARSCLFLTQLFTATALSRVEVSSFFNPAFLSPLLLKAVGRLRHICPSFFRIDASRTRAGGVAARFKEDAFSYVLFFPPVVGEGDFDFTSREPGSGFLLLHHAPFKKGSRFPLLTQVLLCLVCSLGRLA